MDWILSSDRPIWLQLKEQISVGIVTGQYPPGSRLPSVRELAVKAGVNPNTMQRALTELERDGLAHSMGTMGRVVTNDSKKIEEIRRQFADEIIRQYLTGMVQLGYTPKEAFEILEGWTNE